MYVETKPAEGGDIVFISNSEMLVTYPPPPTQDRRYSIAVGAGWGAGGLCRGRPYLPPPQRQLGGRATAQLSAVWGWGGGGSWQAVSTFYNDFTADVRRNDGQ